MRTDKIRKYLIPNIPYLFILWAFLKLGTAYRLAAGNDFAHKLIGLHISSSDWARRLARPLLTLHPVLPRWIGLLVL